MVRAMSAHVGAVDRELNNPHVGAVDRATDECPRGRSRLKLLIAQLIDVPTWAH
jgi:hypothetical protein